jgi:hypothetical protein
MSASRRATVTHRATVRWHAASGPYVTHHDLRVDLYDRTAYVAYSYRHDCDHTWHNTLYLTRAEAARYLRELHLIALTEPDRITLTYTRR